MHAILAVDSPMAAQHVARCAQTPLAPLASGAAVGPPPSLGLNPHSTLQFWLSQRVMVSIQLLQLAVSFG